MKTTYTDEEIQSAIDAAFPKGKREDGFNLDTTTLRSHWESESPNRLSIAKAFLEKLESDPYAEMKKAHAEGKVIQYNCGSNSKPEWEDLPNPVFSDGVDVYRIKPTPSTFTAHGKTWTPSIGDVVRLKSGGPKMTIHFMDAKNGGCVTFSDAGEFTFATLPIACLTLVTE